jgi:hypothetical protein
METFQKWVKRIGAAILLFGLLLVLFVLAGFLLPAELALSTEKSVDVPSETVWRYVSTPEGVVEWWTPLAEKAVEDGYPEMTVEAVDAQTVTFAAGEMQMEAWTLQSSRAPAGSTPGEAVWDVDFGMLTVTRTLEVQPDGSGSKVTWSESATMDNPMMRWMARLSDPTQNFRDAIDGMAR